MEDKRKYNGGHTSAGRKAKAEEEVIKLNHYTNFQPLWAIDNLRKGNKINN